MDIELRELQEIAYEYDFPISDIVDYYETIKNYPCVLAKDEQSLIDCLYLIVQDRVSNSYIISRWDGNGSFQEYIKYNCKPLSYSISDALYRVYEDYAIPNLSEQYKYVKRLER